MVKKSAYYKSKSSSKSTSGKMSASGGSNASHSKGRSSSSKSYSSGKASYGGKSSTSYKSSTTNKNSSKSLETRYNSSGYRQYKDPSSGDFKYTHRRVAEKKVGRDIQPNEHVHHINKVKTDNRPCNLVVVDKDIHKVLHQSEYHEKNACFRCGSTSHWVEDCWAGKDVFGRRFEDRG